MPKVWTAESHALTVQEMKSMFQLNPRLQVSYIDRNKNQVSHVLAILGRVSLLSVTWIETVHDEVYARCLATGGFSCRLINI
jgi:hypothetical protein